MILGYGCNVARETIIRGLRVSPFMAHSRAVSWWLQLDEVKAERAYGDECGTDQLGKLEHA
jgi:hypothetical protein